MKNHLTLLVTSAGRRVELLNCFRADAHDLGLGLRILAADANPGMSAACHAADAAFPVPRCGDEAYIPRLREICVAERVDLLVPTIDPELLPLAAARAAFAAAGTRVAVSDPATVAMARDKLSTVEFLQRHGIAAPRSLPMTRLLEEPAALRYPVILKRIDGSSSVGLAEAANESELRRLRVDPAGYVAQEKWRGREFTVNLFFDVAGACRAAVSHWRAEQRAGEVSKGITVRHPLLGDFSARLARVLPGAQSVLCYQAIIAADGSGVIFEINARFGGGFPLAHRAGARFSRWLLEEAAGLPCTANDAWTEGLAMLRYDAAVFAMLPSNPF